jgi:predicted ATPase
MRIIQARIQRYGSLEDVTFQGKPLTVFIGPNGQGKSQVFESLNRFFTDFNSIGGNVVSPVNEDMWYRRETLEPIEFEIVLELEETEIRQYIPFEQTFTNLVKEKYKNDFRKLTIKRSLLSQGVWKTVEIRWAEISIVTNDVVITTEKILDSISPAQQLKNYILYFFSQGFSKDNVGGDRVLVNSAEKKGFTSHPLIDELVKKGIIQSSNESAGKNWQEWTKENGIIVTAPSASDLTQLSIVSTEMLQKVITGLSTLRGKFKFLPAARDVKSTSGQRTSLLEPNLLQMLTSTSIDRKRDSEKRWERYRRYVEPLLNKRLEPNPTQVLLKEGDLGLLPSLIGGGEQSLMGLIWETMDATAILAIEEPENHLHPNQQREIFDYFLHRANEIQILLCTHSAVFASKPDISGVYLVFKNEEGATQLEQINEANMARIIEELGIRASDILDYDSVTFVEGQQDVKIFQTFARRLAKNTDVLLGFLDAEGWNNMSYYANARVLKSRKIKFDVFAIFDGDTEKEEKRKEIKKRLVEELKLSEDHIITLKKSSIEAYLLVPAGIKRAFPQIRLSVEEIADFIKKNDQKKNKKELLESLLKRGGINTHDAEIIARIAEALRDNEIDEEIKGIFQKLIAGSPKSKPSTTQ